MKYKFKEERYSYILLNILIIIFYKQQHVVLIYKMYNEFVHSFFFLYNFFLILSYYIIIWDYMNFLLFLELDDDYENFVKLTTHH